MIPYRLEDRSREQLYDTIHNFAVDVSSKLQTIQQLTAEIVVLREALETVRRIIWTRDGAYTYATEDLISEALSTSSPQVEALIELVEAVGEMNKKFGHFVDTKEIHEKSDRGKVLHAYRKLQEVGG